MGCAVTATPGTRRGVGSAGDSRGARRRFARVLIALVLFGVSFGYVEAAVVVYLRAIYEPMRRQLQPEWTSGDLFPLLRLSDLETAGEVHVRRLATEVGREAATLVMLAAVGLLFARSFHQWFAGFIIAFGVWDIFYYVFLKMLIGWPESLFTWDILFLIPLPWVGPVIAPAIVAACMIASGAVLLWRESMARPVRLGPGQWLAVVAGGVMIVVAFCWDHRHITAGGRPEWFNWPLFTAGLLLGVAAFVHAVLAEKRSA